MKMEPKKEPKLVILEEENIAAENQSTPLIIIQEYSVSYKIEEKEYHEMIEVIKNWAK